MFNCRGQAARAPRIHTALSFFTEAIVNNILDSSINIYGLFEKVSEELAEMEQVPTVLMNGKFNTFYFKQSGK